jgi:hypothetical protein
MTTIQILAIKSWFLVLMIANFVCRSVFNWLADQTAEEPFLLS